MSSTPEPLAKIGLLSVGEMGLGIAKKLIADGFAVLTNCDGRSQDTIDRATSAQVTILPTDVDLVTQSDVLLSVVPPRDAEATAARVLAALAGAAHTDRPLYYVDMNAVSPTTTEQIADTFRESAATNAAATNAAAAAATPSPRRPVVFIDASILGGPPAPRPDGTWFSPVVPTSGATALASIAPYGGPLAASLHARHLAARPGAASGLKMCFASLAKGHIALGVQALATAHALGVLPDLRAAMAELVPAQLARVEAGLTQMPPKAYRWVREMDEIAATYAAAGFGGRMFEGAADVFRIVADDTVLGAEKTGRRRRGTTAEDVALCVAEGLERRKEKMD